MGTKKPAVAQHIHVLYRRLHLVTRVARRLYLLCCSKWPSGNHGRVRSARGHHANKRVGEYPL
jgi:hypothetical protein